MCIVCFWCYLGPTAFLCPMQYFRPTIHRTYDSCRSDVHSILLIRSTQELQILSVIKYVVDSATIRISLFPLPQICRSDVHTFVGRMHTYPTYKSCASYQQKLCIRPILMMCIRPTQKVCIQPTVKIAIDLVVGQIH